MATIVSSFEKKKMNEAHRLGLYDRMYCGTVEASRQQAAGRDCALVKH